MGANHECWGGGERFIQFIFNTGWEFRGVWIGAVKGFALVLKLQLYFYSFCV